MLEAGIERIRRSSSGPLGGDNDESTGDTEMRMQRAMSYVCQPMYCAYDLMSSRASVGLGIRRFKLSLCNQQILSFQRTPQPSELIG